MSEHSSVRAVGSNTSLGELINAATSFVEAGKIDQACKLYRDWIAQNPQHPLLHVAYFNSSTLESERGDSKATIAALQEAIEHNKDFMPAYINLGGQLERTGAPAQALEMWRSVINRPSLINGSAVNYVCTALKQRARLLLDLELLEPAEEALALSLGINPEQQVIEHYIGARLAQCKWPVALPSENITRAQLIRNIAPLSMSVYTDDPLLQLGSADRYAQSRHDRGVHDNSSDRRNAQIDFPERRLKVGYVSSDLRDHAIGYLMAEFFELHGRNDIEVFAYYCGPALGGPLQDRINAAVEHWTDIKSLSDDEAAAKIAADGIDILVDVNGYTREARMGVFARRPAPIQVNWLGYPGTMATPYHNYIIADDWIIPPGSEIFYTEEVMRLPCYQPNDRKRVVGPLPARKDVGLPEDAFVFCCFNGTHKILRFTFERWMEILNRVPGSVLWLLAPSQETQARLRALAESKGVSGDRLVFAPKVHNPAHLARYQLADLFLDTVPYGAHTTASDALWMGVPVLTLSGRSFASRVCGSLVRSAGLEDLVCMRPQDYVERAVALGNDHAKIETYKKKLSIGKETFTLFDTDNLVGHLEGLYRTMAAKHKSGNTPRPQLTNLSAYLEAGLEFDHEAQEMLTVEDYIGLYKGKLASLHLKRPLPTDDRLWANEDIARVDGNIFRQKKAKKSGSAAAAPRKRRKAAAA